MKVVVDGFCWLDARVLTDQQLENLRSLLTVQPTKVGNYPGQETPAPIELYRDQLARGLFGVPRWFYRKKRKKSHNEDIRVSDGDDMSPFESLMSFEGPYEEQGEAIDVMVDHLTSEPWGGGILEADCGFGKTNCGLEIARRIGKRTIVVVHKEFFLKQWRNRINEFFPGARVGFIQQDVCQFEDCDFVIAMVQSIARDDGFRYPQEMYDAFGLLIGDEIHRMSAPTWAGVAPRFSTRYRLGLTATPERKDDSEDVFFFHIGPIVFKAKTVTPVPKIRKLVTVSELKPEYRKSKRGGKFKIEVDKLSPAGIIKQLCNDIMRTRQIVDDIALAVEKGRKVIVISERLMHLKKITEDLTNRLMASELPFAPVIDFCTGEWFTGEKKASGELKKKKRTEADLVKAESANIIMATKQMVMEGFDIPALDVMYLATPMSDVEQVVGRTRRWCVPDDEKCKRLCPWRAGVCQGKPDPIVVDVIDSRIKKAKRRWYSRRRFYRDIGAMQ